MLVLIELSPLDSVGGSRVVLRAASSDDRAITALNGVRWWPGITDTPTLSIQLFEGDFSTDVSTGTAAFTVLTDKLARLDANARRYRWAGAPVTIYAGNSGDAWPWTTVFQGKVDTFSAKGSKLQLTAKIDEEPFQKNVLTATYAGTGGIEGGTDLANKVKPWLFGRAMNVEPVMIDSVNNVLQFSAYGPIQAVNTLYERASDFGASVGDFASYTALVAATIPAGRWGTCLASGLVRLGAPPFGVITGDVDGDKPSTWLRKTGEILTRIATNAGVSSGLLDSASLSALDTAVPYTINLFLNEQVTVIDLAKKLVRPCNAQAAISWLGKLFVTRVAIGSPALTLDAQGRRRPGVIASTENDVSPPYWRIEYGAQRAWRVHTLDEIAFIATLTNRGAYSSSGFYRTGDIVQDQGASWVYVNSTPGTGNAPPTLPTLSNAYWTGMSSLDWPSVTDSAGTKPADNATRDLLLTGSTGTNLVVGSNSLKQTGSDGVYTFGAYGQPLNGPCFVEVDISPTGWTMVGLDDDNSNWDYTQQVAVLHFNSSTGTLNLYGNNTGAPLYSATLATGLTGKLALAFDRVSLKGLVAGVERFSVAAPAGLTGAIYPKWWAYNSNITYTGLRAGYYAIAPVVGSTIYDTDRVTPVPRTNLTNDSIDIAGGKPTNVAAGATAKFIDNSLASLTPGGTFLPGTGASYALTGPGLDAAMGLSRYSPGDNLIRNPDLNLNTDFWTFLGVAPTRTAGSLAGDPPFYFTGPTTPSTSVADPQNGLADAAVAEPGKYYRFEALAKGSFTVYLQFYDAAGTELSATGNNFTFSTAAWTPIQCGRVAPVNAARVFVQIWFTGSADKLGQPRLMAIRTDTTTSPLALAVNKNADIKEVATDGRPACWYPSAPSTVLSTTLTWKDPATKTIMTTTVAGVILVNTACKVEPNTIYDIEMLWGADGGANTASQVAVMEYDSDLPAGVVTIAPSGCVVDPSAPSVAPTRTSTLYNGALADASGGSYAQQTFTYTPAATAKWAVLYVYEGFAQTYRMLVKRAYIRNKATWGTIAGTDLKNSSRVVQTDAQTFNGNNTMTSSGVYTNGAGGTYTIDALNVLHGPTESGADNTANQQVTATWSPAQNGVTINADNSGAIIAGQLAMTLAIPKVTKGGASVAADNLTTYAISGTSASLGSVAVDYTNGSATKGQVTIPAGVTGSGAFILTISYNGKALPALQCQVTVVNAPPSSGGGSGVTSGNFSVSDTVTSTSFVQVGSTFTLTVASGKTIHGTFGDTYLCGGINKSGQAVMKWQYAATGTSFASPTDFGTAVTGTAATTDSDFNQSPGSITCNQNVTPAAATYDVRLVCEKSGTALALSFDTVLAYLSVS